MIHQVRNGDTVAALALRYYSDATRWRDVVRENDLRYPYISDDPAEQFGPITASYPVQQELSAGQRSIAIGGGDAALIRSGVQVSLSRHTTAGAVISDSHIVEDFAGGAINLQTSLVNSYPIGTFISIHPSVLELRGKVAKPGDLLIFTGQEEPQKTEVIDDRYGRDLACDKLGRLVLTDTGDLSIIEGASNLLQQLTHRLKTELGLLVLHPTYGNAAMSYVGKANGPTLILLIQTATTLALGSDPRIASVDGVSASTAGDAITISATATAIDEKINIGVAL